MPKSIAFVLLGLVVVGCSRDEIGEHEHRTGSLASAAMNAAENSPSAPDSSERQWQMGNEHLNSGDAVGALGYFNGIPRDGSTVSVDAALAAAQLQESLGRLSAAIESYEYVLNYQPKLNPVTSRVAELYALTGQRAEADRHLTRLMRTPDLGFKPLVLLTDFERRHGEDQTRLEEFERLAPDDPAVQLGLAVENIEDGAIDSAQHRLQAAIAADPELATAQALLGEVLLLQSSNEELMRWHQALPASVQDHPAIWYTRGLWALRVDEPAVAARCFWESARQCPTSYRAAYQLGQISTGLDPQVRQSFAKRAEDIYELKQNLSGVLDSGGRDAASAHQLLDLLREMGREWEAWSWAVTLQSKHLTASWLRQTLAQLSSYPHSQSPRMLQSANLTVRFDLSELPEFARILTQVDATARADDGIPQKVNIRFEDVGPSVGLDFRYHRGNVAGLDGVRMQETTGGGTGILDYDSDGWPDLFLTQGEDWPAGADQPADNPALRDVIFRNRGPRFDNCTLVALPADDGFGQGCACGDFNNDGFADIYVANIGVNHLLINLGDGTFADGTPQGVSTLSAWTTSCAMADLNADGHPDLFDVNYVEGPQLFRMICNENDCSPQEYAESLDDALISSGDGAVRLIQQDTHSRRGAGLAVVVFRADQSDWPSLLDGAPRFDIGSASAVADTAPLVPERDLSLFIANDQDPNEFLKVRRAADLSLTLVDDSFLAGLALDYNGETSACMGVAAGDITGDGRLDLFVTNYQDEANSFFVQEPSGMFGDGIGGSGLLHAGMPYIGWGTQCLDADGDGDLDLVVANGHVGYFARPGLQERMPAQVFRNTGAGRFREVPAEESGDFFHRRLMGRSLATLDWNCDGRTDLVLSTLDESPALLENQTWPVQNWIAVRLTGVQSARDAVGTVVTIHTNELTIRSQLTGGCGYQATNERLLRFGLGGEATVNRMTVEWPSGRTQEFTELSSNRVLLLREGRDCLDAPRRSTSENLLPEGVANPTADRRREWSPTTKNAHNSIES